MALYIRSLRRRSTAHLAVLSVAAAVFRAELAALLASLACVRPSLKAIVVTMVAALISLGKCLSLRIAPD